MTDEQIAANMGWDVRHLRLSTGSVAYRVCELVAKAEAEALAEMASLDMHDAAVKLVQGMGYAWIGSEWTRNTPKQYGCHCDLEPGMNPDGCVLDYGHATDCMHAPGLVAAGKSREDCHEWRPVDFSRAPAGERGTT